MANKAISEETPLSPLMSAAQIRLSYLSANWNTTILDLATYINSLGSPLVSVVIASGAYLDISLGSRTAYHGVSIDYASYRGTRVRRGQILIACDGTTTGFTEIGTSTLPNTETEDGGITFTSSGATGQIVLRVTCDASDATSTTFNYRKALL
jgi:hypothetical protein